MTFPIPPNEATRLAALQALEILDTSPTRDFNSLVRLARDLLKVPISAISLVDQHRQWFKAIEGLDCKETSREIAFCAHTICAAEPLIVHDAIKDDRFRGNVLVRESPKIRFYAGIPLEFANGLRLGSFCIMDTKPRSMTEKDLARLQQLSEMAIALLSNHARSVQTGQQAKIIGEQEQRLLKNNKLLESACELGKLGAWERDVATGQLWWTESMFGLHEMSVGMESNIAEHLNLYPEPERTRLTALIADADRTKRPFRFEGRMYTATGKLKWVRLASEVELDGGRLVRRYGVKQDITEEKTLLERVRRLANSDELTGLANRRVLRRRLTELGNSSEMPVAITLLTLDLDGFKEINDTHGHVAGDACLRRVARRLKAALQPGVLVARTGGDEFAIVCDGTEGPVPDDLIEKVFRAVHAPITWRGHGFHLTCSIGAATREVGCRVVPDELLHEADLALYEAKR